MQTEGVDPKVQSEYQLSGYYTAADGVKDLGGRLCFQTWSD